MGDRGFESSPSGGETVANLTSSIRGDPGRMAPGLAGLRVGAFWEPGDPALISLPGPAWLGSILNHPLVDRQKASNSCDGLNWVLKCLGKRSLEKAVLLTGDRWFESISL